jgi:hypothetical protein
VSVFKIRVYFSGGNSNGLKISLFFLFKRVSGGIKPSRFLICTFLSRGVIRIFS